jgi:hypothetical protein
MIVPYRIIIPKILIKEFDYSENIIRIINRFIYFLISFNQRSIRLRSNDIKSVTVKIDAIFFSLLIFKRANRIYFIYFRLMTLLSS